MNEKIPQAALIGVTGYGSAHLKWLEHLQTRNAVRLRAAVVINPEMAGDQLAILKILGTEVFADSAAMFEKYRGQLDLCCLPTSIPSHRPLSIQAMESGMNVLVEKPLASVMEDVEAIIASEKRTGHFVAVGFQTTYLRRIQDLKHLLLSGSLGGIKEARLLCIWPRNNEYYLRNHWAGRIRTDSGDWTLDSPLANAMAHYVNLVLLLCGKSMETSDRVREIHGGLYRCQNIENFDTACLEAMTENDIRTTFHVSHSALETHGPHIEIFCEKGRISLENCKKITIARDDGTSEELLSAEEETQERMFEAVLRRISNPSEWICTTSIAAAHTQFIHTLYETLPVTQIPPDRLQSAPLNDQIQTYLPGIEQRLIAAFKDGSVLKNP